MKLEGDLMEIATRRRGQSGEPIELTFDMLNDNELAVMKTLGGAPEPMKIAEIMLANQWQIPDKAKGNSRVRNSLRKLMRGSWIQRTDAGFQTTDLGRGELGLSEPENTGRNPMEISHAKVIAMRFDMTTIGAIKKADCALYNTCLETAIAGNWSGFSCASCTGYTAPDSFQKESDAVRLRAVQMAAEMIEQYGNAGRVRGVKPGPDAKRTVREEMVPLVVALRVID